MRQNKTDTAGVVAPPPLVVAAALVAGLLLHLAFPVRFIPLAWKARLIVAAPFLAVSAALALLSYKVLRLNSTPVDPGKPTVKVVVDGPYRFTRNPLYVSLLLLYSALAVLLNSLWPVLLLPPLFAVLHFGVVVREEKYLEGKFGPAYLDYKKRVRRWI
jgi:protein-S-isoprenylcysteine O-methyltransferase Ste14